MGSGLPDHGKLTARACLRGPRSKVAWLREPSPEVSHASDPPLSMLLPLLALAAATVYSESIPNGRQHRGDGRQACSGACDDERRFPEWLVLLAVLIRSSVHFSFRSSQISKPARNVTLVRQRSLLHRIPPARPVRDGARPEAHILDVATGLALLSRSSRGAAVALAASSLWIVNSIYSIATCGRMRSPPDHFYVLLSRRRWVARL